MPYRDGPYLVRGAFSLRDQDGGRIETARRTVALCRCGKSQTRPFCDGTHRLIRFKATSAAERQDGKARQTRASAKPSLASSAPPGKNPTNGDGPTSPGRSGRAGPSRPRAARARDELRRSDDLLRRLLDARAHPQADPALRTAAPLVTAVLWLMDQLAPGIVPPPAGEELAACLRLVHGALDALADIPDGGDEHVRVLISQLRTVADQLEPTDGVAGG